MIIILIHNEMVLKKKWRINEIHKILIDYLVSSICQLILLLQKKWDMALAYGAGNFHSANATEFAKNVTEKSRWKTYNCYSPRWFII